MGRVTARGHLQKQGIPKSGSEEEEREHTQGVGGLVHMQCVGTWGHSQVLPLGRWPAGTACSALLCSLTSWMAALGWALRRDKALRASSERLGCCTTCLYSTLATAPAFMGDGSTLWSPHVSAQSFLR